MSNNRANDDRAIPGPGYSDRHRTLAKLGDREIALAVLHHMNIHRPPGERRWYPGRATLSPILDWVAEPIEELERYVEDAAAVVAAGLQAPHHWTPGNLFGPRARFKWCQVIDQHKAGGKKPTTIDERRKAAREELDR